MATITNLATTGNNVDATSFTTASITPAANSLVLAWVYSIAAAQPNTPTASGNSLTYVQVGTQTDTNSLRTITLFRAMGGAPTAGAITFDFAGQTQTGCAWTIASITGTNVTGTSGSGAIVQSNTAATVGTATSLTITLTNGLSAASNIMLAGFGMPLNTAALPAISNSAILIGQSNQASPNQSIGSEYLDNTTSLTMNAAANSVPWVSVAVEVKLPVGKSNFTNNLRPAIFRPGIGR